jgi:hypothetical protein
LRSEKSVFKKTGQTGQIGQPHITNHRNQKRSLCAPKKVFSKKAGQTRQLDSLYLSATEIKNALFVLRKKCSEKNRTNWTNWTTMYRQPQKSKASFLSQNKKFYVKTK